jgi:hypothetical protein
VQINLWDNDYCETVASLRVKPIVLDHFAYQWCGERGLLVPKQELIDKIDEFEEKCKDGKHTDTGAVWELLHLIRHVLESHIDGGI